MNETGRKRIEARRLAGYAFVAGMVLAPFLALIYGWNVGLTVMGFALGATTYIAIDTLRSAPPEAHGRLRALIAVNALFCAACFVLLAIRVR
jgi:hypothetical protein